MYRRTPQASAARRRLPPPSILSLRSVARAAAMSAGFLGKKVSWSMTASAPDLRTASSTAAASSASTSATSAPSSFRPCVLALRRVIPVTAWPWRTNSVTSGRPIAPVAPATKTFMVVLLWGSLVAGLPRSRSSANARPRRSVFCALKGHDRKALGALSTPGRRSQGGSCTPTGYDRQPRGRALSPPAGDRTSPLEHAAPHEACDRTPLGYKTLPGSSNPGCSAHPGLCDRALSGHKTPVVVAAHLRCAA